MAVATEQDIRSNILDLMSDASQAFIEGIGGYTDAIDGHTIPGWVVVATGGDTGEPRLDLYRWEYLEAVYALAQEWAEESKADADDDRDLVSAWWEAMDAVKTDESGLPK